MSKEEVELDAEAWKREITEKLQRKVEKGEENMSIYKVPTRLRRVKDEAYNCRVVSIGPFQLENPDLAAMREHKWHYLQFFLKRVGDDEQSRRILEEFTTSIYDLDAEVRGCYSEKFNHIDKNVLAEIMLLDGCFILELLLRYDQHLNKKLGDQSDVIFNSAWMIAAFQHDLALLENQIPFFILKLLYDSIKIHLRGHPSKSVTNLALSFFQPTNHKAIEKTLDPTKDYKHFLDLLHKFYLPSGNPFLVNSPSHQVSVDLTPQNQHVPMVQPNASSRVNPKAGAKRIKAWGFNFTATKLLGGGIEFESGSTEDHLLNITFRNGVIRIPPATIQLTSDALFRNMIAFEQCSLSSTHHITSYMILMKSLICSTEDLKLLRRRGIIKLLEHSNSSDQQYLNQFKTMLDRVVVKDFYFSDLCDQVNEYKKSWVHWKKHKISTRVRFKRHIKFLYGTYFSSPWSIISFLGALALFTLTVIQTYYTIHPPR